MEDLRVRGGVGPLEDRPLQRHPIRIKVRSHFLQQLFLVDILLLWPFLESVPELQRHDGPRVGGGALQLQVLVLVFVLDPVVLSGRRTVVGGVGRLLVSQFSLVSQVVPFGRVAGVGFPGDAVQHKQGSQEVGRRELHGETLLTL